MPILYWNVLLEYADSVLVILILILLKDSNLLDYVQKVWKYNMVYGHGKKIGVSQDTDLPPSL
jgi:hypothetical protein